MPTVKPLDHDTATAKQKRGHYSSGCRDQACRDAANDYQKEASARRKAAALAASTTPEPSGEDENVEPPVSTPAAGTASADSAPAPASSPELSRGGIVNLAGGGIRGMLGADAPERVVPLPHPAPASVAGRTSARGASRRLQALVWLWYPPVDLAKATQISVDTIWWLLFTPPESIQDVNHRIILTHYNRMKILPPELPAPVITRAKELAGDHGWCGPFDWNDIDTDAKPIHGKLRPSRAEVLQERVDELEGELAKRLEYSVPPTAPSTEALATQVELAELQHELEVARTMASSVQASLELEQTMHAATRSSLRTSESELFGLSNTFENVKGDLQEVGEALAQADADLSEAIAQIPEEDGLTLIGNVAGQRVEIPVVLRLSIVLGE